MGFSRRVTQDGTKLRFPDTSRLLYEPKRFGHAFMFDSGSSTGEIIGHSKVLYLPPTQPVLLLLDRVTLRTITSHRRSLMPSRSDINGHSAQRQPATIILSSSTRVNAVAALRASSTTSFSIQIPGAPYRYDKARQTRPFRPKRRS